AQPPAQVPRAGAERGQRRAGTDTEVGVVPGDDEPVHHEHEAPPVRLNRRSADGRANGVQRLARVNRTQAFLGALRVVVIGLFVPGWFGAGILLALATQPLRRLSTVDEDPVAAWRRGDPDVVAALARLERRRLGLHH